MPAITKTLFAVGLMAMAMPPVVRHDESAPPILGFASGLVPDGLSDTPPEAWAPQDSADAMYRQAREALMKGEYREAAGLFRQLVEKWPRSTYVADALYWRAFALYRVGGADALGEAQQVLQEHDRRFPNARTRADARTLATRIRGTLAQQGDARSAERIVEQARQAPGTACPKDEDSDVRIAAINAVMQMNEESALPILRDVLKKREACSERLRSKAVFILSQQMSREAEALMLETVRNDPSREVREQAVQWLGQMHGESATAALADIATRSPDQSLREKAVFALMQQNSDRATTVVRTLAERDDTPARVREQAVFWIGQQGTPANAQFLRTLFARVGRTAETVELRKKILFSLSQMTGEGNDRWLMTVANDGSQPIELRKHALWAAGEAGVKSAEFIALYDRVSDVSIKEHLIWVLSQHSDRAATDKLIEIARRDPNVQMRKKALFWLGQSGDPRVQQLLLEIINKG